MEVKKMINKKAQEEMIGFVLIVVLVSVIALIFLAISIRKTDGEIENKEIEKFLHASLLFSIECKEDRNYDFKDLIKACYNNEQCLDGDNPCDLLDKTALELVENSFKIYEKAK